MLWRVPVLVFLASLAVPQVARASEPCDPAEDVSRITAHLLRVESLLRARDTAGLTSRQIAARLRHLDRLRSYAARQEYPRNDDFPGERVPYFVDDRGVHCAVAFLVAASGRTDLVGEVVAHLNNARVMNMRSPELAAWAAEEGFTVEELALIQPDYCGGCYSTHPCIDRFCSPNDPMANNSCVSVLREDGEPCGSTGLEPDEGFACYERICQGGECVDGRPRDCDDGDPTTADSCEKRVGCVNEPETTDDGSCAWTGEPATRAPMAVLLVLAALALSRRTRGDR